MRKQYKHCKLEKDTEVLLNKAKAKILTGNPSTERMTDDLAISTALKSFLGETNK